ncbi:MAG: LLM class flavin-dependent oxidoreductase, partial [Proteobacteria bacterium]|nr:LLM class flavin-dependent oxidoreductase [Pseudomonadota bacterium]
MKFGIFDHMDQGAGPLGEQFESRLRLIEAYDRAGFHAYHLAEHHATPLGMAPSPSVFLAAVAQRTRRLRFGPLVYTLALYHPLRLAEEICMLDHLSGGRLEVGIGRGISGYELGYYGVDAKQSQAIYVEALSVILQALANDTVNFEGAHFRFRDVPIEMAP